MKEREGLRVVGLAKAYGGAPALAPVSLAVAPGEVVALLGPSGAGKTTLLRLVGGAAAPDAGEAWAAGRPMHALRGAALRAARREVGVVAQGFDLVRRLPALDNAAAGRLAEAPLWRVLARRPPAAARAAALAALERVGLAERAHQRADTLSGGQQQRVAIARALVQGGRVLLADEPVASLDPANAALVLGLLRELARERHLAVLVSLHQPDLARAHCDRAVVLAPP